MIGPYATDLAVDLKKEMGVSERKICRLFAHFGLTITPGGVAQAIAREEGGTRCEKAEPVEENLTRSEGPPPHTRWFLPLPAHEPNPEHIDAARGANLLRGRAASPTSKADHRSRSHLTT